MWNVTALCVCVFVNMTFFKTYITYAIQVSLGVDVDEDHRLMSNIIII